MTTEELKTRIRKFGIRVGPIPFQIFGIGNLKANCTVSVIRRGKLQGGVQIKIPAGFYQ